MQKNEEYVVTIQNLGSNGEGVAKIDNTIVFVPFCLPQEKVKIKILKVLKNFAYAKLIEILSQSKNRVEPVCPVFKKCGGCQLQHLKYDEQLRFKQDLIITNFKKFANIDIRPQKTIKSDFEYAYRNKLQMPIEEVNGEVKIGFYAPNSHNIIATKSCALHGAWAEKLICIVLKYIDISGEKAHNTMQTGNIRHLVARLVDDSLVVVIVANLGKIKSPQILIDLLKKEFNSFSLFVNKNDSDNNVILGEKFDLLYGSPYQTIQNFGIKYEVSPQSFLQVNQNVQNKIYSNVLDEVDSNDIVVDAYSGAGLLSAIVSKKAKKVYGIEIVTEASKNASTLAKNNGIMNMQNICGDCAVELPKLVKSLKAKNLTVILDPARKGCDKKVLEAINCALPKKVIYISCNSATLARDAKILLEKYQIEKTIPFDMFPQTSHVETLCIFKKITKKV